MIRKKIQLLLLGIALCPVYLFADNEGFVVHMNNDIQKGFKFSETKKITFAANGFNVINKQNNEVGSYLFDEVDKITFEGTITDIDHVTVTNNNMMLHLSRDGQTIIIDNIYDNCSMRIFTVTGTMVMYMPQFNDNRIDISNLSEGIYILSINNQTFKFKK